MNIKNTPPNRLDLEFPDSVPLSDYLHKIEAWQQESPGVYRPGWPRLLGVAWAVVFFFAVPYVIFPENADFLFSSSHWLLLVPVAAFLSYFLFSKQLNFTLRIDESGIQAGDRIFYWEDVEAVGFMRKQGIDLPVMLVLPYNRPVEKIQLGWFPVKRRRLAAVIGFFQLQALKKRKPAVS